LLLVAAPSQWILQALMRPLSFYRELIDMN